MKKVLKKLAAFLLAMAIVCTSVMATDIETKAESAPVTMTTTMACSVWSAPATVEAHRVKKIDAGYSVTVYPDVVQSTAGDGKTFYMTVKGNYILCKCFDGDVSTVPQVTGETAVMATIKECSIWSAPATIEANRIQKVPAGYQATVYTTVVQSTAGDGKTFYQTTDGTYILCNCFTATAQTTSAPAVTANPTLGQQQALKKAKSYLSFMAFSREGLIGQLQYEGFTLEEATYGADASGANWYEQATKKAQSYLRTSSFSRDGLIHQLEFEGFTNAEAVYGADTSGANWYEQAGKKAQSYLRIMSFSRDGLIHQLEFEGFTHDEAVYGVTVVGY